MASAPAVKTAHFALHRTERDLAEVFATDQVCLGAMVPKRWAKRAVTRNLIKRQIYSLGSLSEATLLKAAYVVRLRATFDRTQFKSASSEQLKTAVRSELAQLFLKAAAPLPKVNA